MPNIDLGKTYKDLLPYYDIKLVRGSDSGDIDLTPSILPLIRNTLSKITITAEEGKDTKAIFDFVYSVAENLPGKDSNLPPWLVIAPQGTTGNNIVVEAGYLNIPSSHTLTMDAYELSVGIEEGGEKELPKGSKKTVKEILATDSEAQKILDNTDRLVVKERDSSGNVISETDEPLKTTPVDRSSILFKGVARPGSASGSEDGTIVYSVECVQKELDGSKTITNTDPVSGSKHSTVKLLIGGKDKYIDINRKLIPDLEKLLLATMGLKHESSWRKVVASDRSNYPGGVGLAQSLANSEFVTAPLKEKSLTLQFLAHARYDVALDVPGRVVTVQNVEGTGVNGIPAKKLVANELTTKLLYNLVSPKGATYPKALEIKDFLPVFEQLGIKYIKFDSPLKSEPIIKDNTVFIELDGTKAITTHLFYQGSNRLSISGDTVAEAESDPNKVLAVRYGEAVLSFNYNIANKTKVKPTKIKTANSTKEGLSIGIVVDGKYFVSFEIDDEAIKAVAAKKNNEGKDFTQAMDELLKWAQDDPDGFLREFTELPLNNNTKSIRVDTGVGGMGITLTLNMKYPIPGIKTGTWIAFDTIYKSNLGILTIPKYLRGVFKVKKVVHTLSGKSDVWKQSIECVR